MKKLNPLASDLNFILDHTQPYWSELKNQSIFITGGTGFFGCWLLESLLWANQKFHLNCSVCVLTRDIEAFKKKSPHLASDPLLRFHRGDVRDFTFPEGTFSHIIHAATEASAQLNREQPEIMFGTITKGMRHVLDFAKHCSAKKLLFTSSGAVYGVQPPNVSFLSELYEGDPKNMGEKAPYGAAKKMAEELCIRAANASSLEVKIARCFAFIGPYLPLDTHFAIGNFILAGLHHEPIHIQGDGTPYRSYLYAADLMIWLWTILFRGENKRSYNVGSDRAISIAQLAHVVAGAFEPSVKVEISKKPILGRPADRYVPSIERARKELGLQQRVSLLEAIQKTKVWYSRKLRIED